MVRSFSGAGVAASVDWTRNDGAKRLKASRPMPRLVWLKNSRRVVGRKLSGFSWPGALAKLVFGRLEHGHYRIADAIKAVLVGAIADQEGFHIGAEIGVDGHGEKVVAQARGELAGVELGEGLEPSVTVKLSMPLARAATSSICSSALSLASSSGANLLDERAACAKRGRVDRSSGRRPSRGRWAG